MVSVQDGCTVPFATKFCCKNNRIEIITPVFSLKSLLMRSLSPLWGVLTTPKLVLLPEKVPERTLAVRGKARVALDDQHWKRPAASETAIERS